MKKKHASRWLVMKAAAFLASAGSCGAWDFEYGYATVFAANADAHVASQVHVEKSSSFLGRAYTPTEFSPGVSHLTYKFVFDAPVARARLRACFDVGTYSYFTIEEGIVRSYGFGSLWASTNGQDWQLLLDAFAPPGDSPFPNPTLVLANYTYDRVLPDSLMGASTIWVQARLQQTFPSYAGFGLSPLIPGEDVFRFDADLQLPRLRITALDNTLVQLTWSTNHPGYTLLSASARTDPIWTPVTENVSVIGDRYSVVVRVSESGRLFRLVKQ